MKINFGIIFIINQKVHYDLTKKTFEVIELDKKLKFKGKILGILLMKGF